MVDIRGHRGFLIFMQFVNYPGPFCRDCGLAIYRKMTQESLWIGWWGVLSVVINPLTMLTNLVSRSALMALPPPIPGGPRLPMAPGRPLYQRPAIIAFLAVLVVLILLVVILSATS